LTFLLSAIALALALALDGTADLRDDPAGRSLLQQYIGGTSWECFGGGGILAYSAPAWRGQAEEAARAAERALPRITSMLGVEPRQVLPLWILVSPRGEGFAREAPTWSAALAQPGRRLVVLSGPALQKTSMNLEETVAHEIAHIVLRARVGELGWVPRWLDEGLAMRLSGYGRFGDRLAGLGRGPLDLRDLADQFPREATLARQAYLESEAAVRRLDEQGSLGPLLDRLAAGEDFEPAFEAVCREPFDSFAARIAGEVPAFWRFIATMRGTGLLWAFGAALVVLGALRVRNRNRRRMREWEAADSGAGTADSGTGTPDPRTGAQDSDDRPV
jgi:hypothetical protein